MKRPSTVVLLLTLMLGVVPLGVGAYGGIDIAMRPDRTTAVCQRHGETVTCDAYHWWKDGAGWRSERAGRHVAQRATIQHYVLGRGRGSCVAFDASSLCGGDAKRNAEVLRGLGDGANVDIDATRSETLGLVMGYGSLTGLLLLLWLTVLGVLLRRRWSARGARTGY